MSLTTDERERLEKAKEIIEKLLKEDDKAKKEPEVVDYGSRERREW